MKGFRGITLFLAVVAALGLGVTVAKAQTASGRIVGNVVDPNRGAIPGAKITVVNVATQVHYDTTADKDGYFQAQDLPIGRYTVTVHVFLKNCLHPLNHLQPRHQSPAPSPAIPGR